ncbi:DUF4270 family protein [Carboxylicivirga taeanensis]|uniref:DUF4270 family protein n=1 Tax=Carboxylicivirga taeanensis TaxID=1416875 RepID=UPI003F6DBDB1
MKKYSPTKIFTQIGQSLVIGLLSLTIACEDEPARLSGDVLPEGEMIKGMTFNGHDLLTTNVERESVRTSDATYGVIGDFKDPEFGRSKAGFLTNFSIGKRVGGIIVCDTIIGVDPDSGRDTVIYEDVSFDKFNNNGDERYPYDTWTVDSVVISLKYQFNNWYGNMLAKQEVDVYELITDIGLGTYDQPYYSDHEVAGMYDVMPIASGALHPNDDVPQQYRSAAWNSEAAFWANPDSLWNAPGYLWEVDSAYIADGGKGHQQTTKAWNFKLNETVQNRIFNLDETDLSSTGNFTSAFGGIYVALAAPTEDEKGWLTKVNLNSSAPNTDMTIYFNRIFKKIKEWDIVGSDTIPVFTTDTTNYSYVFPVNIENNRFNVYEHQLESTVSTEEVSQERIYIQGMAGSYMKMQLPEEILSWTDSIKNPENNPVDDYRLVSNIEFFMEIDTVSSKPDYYPVPDKLSIKWKDKEGELVTPIYTIEKFGDEITTPLFGRDIDGDGVMDGVGERKIRYSEEGRPEYIYRFIMRADVFNYIMMHQDGGGLDTKEFYIGPENTTANFQRVVLFGGADADKPLRMNIKYYQYRPR